MTYQADTSDPRNATPMLCGRSLLLAIAMLVATLGSGCSRLRLPAIDPTGEYIVAPSPYATTLTNPSDCFGCGQGCTGFGCCNPLNKLQEHCNNHKCKPPKSAFPEPAPPPPCPPPAPVPSPQAINNEPCVPSEPCNGSCKDGPPAVLYGKECEVAELSSLPTVGQRGCILLTPQKVVAPVGGEVVLLSGICGTDGYLQMNQTLEWMLTPESVGTFIEIGNDDPGLVHRLARIKKEHVKKHDPSYAMGITSTKRTKITRGNLDPRDDVQLEKGQTWISISSPSEGTSRVTVLAPDSECWDQRKATATIYWVDARWQFPGPQVVAKGQPVELTTRVTRSEGGLPARGWKVRYEILQPQLASFGGSGAPVVEVPVDDSGNASVQLVPNPGAAGNATIAMQVIRPGGESDNIPTMTLGSGQTLVTWSAPSLAVRAGAPAVATFDTPFQVVANVSNPGDQAANNVRLDVQIPPGARVTSADSFARVLPNAVGWEIGTIPAKTQLDLYLNVASQSPIDLIFQARGDGLVAEDAVRIDVFRPSLSLRVAPVQERVESGEQVTFNIDVTNTGNRPLQNVYLTATGDAGMVHEGGGRGVRNPKEDGPLQPGQTWGAKVVFVPTQAGQRCISIDAFADGGQRFSQQGCVTAINPVPRTPALTATLEGRERISIGQTVLIRARVVNTGQAPARGIRVTISYDPQLRLSQATEGADESRVNLNQVMWTAAQLDPGQPMVLEGRFEALSGNTTAAVRVTAESSEGVRANAGFALEITGASQSAPSMAPPQLPPIQPTPELSGGPEPLQGAPPNDKEDEQLTLNGRRSARHS